ncbi:hypothetical protein COCNU_01G016900 [Cocos nucifera]|uniref:Uncharacterized protein n=1 Tax=Cocos nucifera TaxID=13894 RepID=A0A8K0HW31_COCNU|nr:hypothetical protein COCNU_01G016900 [Cocos nucifera]
MRRRHPEGLKVLQVEYGIALFCYYFTLKRHPGSCGWWYVSPQSDEWSFIDWGEPQEAMLKELSFNQCLRKDLETLHSFEILELNELLSEQTLFNMGISQVGPEEVDPNLLKMIDSKTLRKKVAEPTGGRSTHAKVEHLLASPTFRCFENGYMEHFAELSTEMRKHKIDVEMLKITKDKIVKIAREASTRANATERRAKDAKEALRETMEENFWLLGTQEALEAKVKELRTQSARIEELETKVAEVKIMLKATKKKIVEFQSKLEA